jgi:uncharacterized protein YktA (UPF0223 family)
MSKCIGDCARCELPVDKYACCAYQTFKNVLELKSRVKALEEQINKESEVVQYKTLDDLDESETSK